MGVILGIEAVKNNEVKKVFCKACREAFGDVAASNSSYFIDKQREKFIQGEHKFSLYIIFHSAFCF